MADDTLTDFSLIHFICFLLIRKMGLLLPSISSLLFMVFHLGNSTKK